MRGVSRALLAVAAICALATLWAAAGLPERSGWLVLFKPLTTALLAAAAGLGRRGAVRYGVAIVAGLLASLAGDVFLMLPGDLFVAGLAAFLVAHLFYLAAFTTGVRFAA